MTWPAVTLLLFLSWSTVAQATVDEAPAALDVRTVTLAEDHSGAASGPGLLPPTGSTSFPQAANVQNATLHQHDVLVAPDCPACCLRPTSWAEPPPWLPDYSIKAEVDPNCRTVRVHQNVVWTNPTAVPTDRLVFHIYPNHRPTKKQLEVYERTLESLRLDPRIGIDRDGERIHIRKIQMGDAELSYSIDAEHDTVMTVPLPITVGPGESVEVTLDYDLEIPPVQGRFGQYNGITSLLNWYPVLAYYGGEGWAPVPFVGWHQPWFNEAGHYHVELTVPQGEIVVASGQMVAAANDDRGMRHLSYEGRGLRDFAVTMSPRFELHQAEVDGIKVTVAAVPEHRYYARMALETAVECLPLYTKWFGPYAYPEFKISESYFGWNGNETSGMVCLDARVFEAPRLGRVYIDSLVGHEICHQWWYAAVGTDGFHETWMDEGLVSYLSQLRMQEKYGRDVQILNWPRYAQWLPNISYRTLQHYGYQLYYNRGGRGISQSSLPTMGHLHNVFFLAYDRGSLIFSMLHQRLGNECFFNFLATVYAKYRFRILFVSDFERELDEYTGHSWKPFFDAWLRSPGVTDWKIKKVRVEEFDGGFKTNVLIKQRKEIDEPIDLGFAYEKKGPIVGTVRVDPHLPVEGNTSLQQVGPHEWEVTLVTPERPKQIILDPDERVLDVNPANNRWKWDPEIRLTPIYNPLDETPIVYPLNRPSIAAGPGIDLDGRIGIRGSLISPTKYRVSPYYAYSWADAQQGVGVDSEFFNLPLPNFSVGGRYERTVADGISLAPANQGKFFLRWYQAYTSSYVYDYNAYAETYFLFGQNFFPGVNIRREAPPGIENYTDIRAIGLRYHLDTRMPYWNPEKGYQLDAGVEFGFHAFGAGESFQRGWAQLSAVHKLPEGLGWFSDTRVVGRLAGGVGSPDNGQHFRFGGPLRFRGYRSEDVEGNAFWLTSLEWRLPLLKRINVGVCDNMINLQELWGGVFIDMGDSFILQTNQGFDQAIGWSTYFDFALLSFVEEMTLRVDYAYSLQAERGLMWVGLFYAF
ncbi:Aminopeptidase N [Planctomycetes bacterium Pan216]|uniref:Aminopeptidase N n=1 Tax=Kolteria novifilia TaxID=2527975 RepID=A0A518B6F9_9BACT|nr:Aminopeptidase N [Planctomycetes bacterium Pan216]